MTFTFHTKEQEWAKTLPFLQGCMLSTQFNCFSNFTQGSVLKAYIHPTKFCLPPKVKAMIENGTQKEGCTQERRKVNKNFLKIKAEFKLIKKMRGHDLL